VLHAPPENLALSILARSNRIWRWLAQAKDDRSSGPACATPSRKSDGDRPSFIDNICKRLKSDGLSMKYSSPKLLGLIAAAVLLVCALQCAALAASGPYFSFDPSGSVITQPQAIAPDGTIAGYFFDSSFIDHGFVRSSSGVVTAFDPPDSVNNTLANGINSDGTIVGYYVDAAFVAHGFLRTWSGVFTHFDPPSSQGIFPSSINSFGTTTGYYYDAGFTIHGFLRSPAGVFTSSDPPGPLFYQQQLYPQSINPAGAVTGIYEDSSFSFHGFLRAPDGTFTTFDPLGSAYTQPYGINPSGVITGYYFPCMNYCAPRGFIRASKGGIVTFDYPNTNQGTFPFGINPTGTITGNYFSNNLYHGFLRTSNGSFSSFDFPNSMGTSPVAINPTGAITGFYYDANFVAHGFFRNPK
jgi:hypothetical protein